ncbi:uncharacterized protein [Periplaneta americana]|uniref:uncharacterized protein n=1 Tax=Periplaneta americana TaxID=6978 RepID=UPI0037E7541B
MDSTIMGNDVALAIDNPLILKEERYKVPFEVRYAYFPDVRDEWLNEPYAITRKYNIINSEKVYTEVVRKMYGANQLHTDWSLVLPCGNTEMSFINAPSTHEDTYHRNICLGNGEHRIECTDPKESSLHVWRKLCDPSCLTYKEKPEIVAKAPKMRFYRKRCDEACPNYKAKSEIVEKKGKRRKNRLWRETCIETCPNYKAKTTKRGEKRKHSALKEEVMDIEAIVQQLNV